MKDVEKFESFEDLKKSEDTQITVSSGDHDLAEEFIQLLKKNSREKDHPKL